MLIIWFYNAIATKQMQHHYNTTLSATDMLLYFVCACHRSSVPVNKQCTVSNALIRDIQNTDDLTERHHGIEVMTVWWLPLIRGTDDLLNNVYCNLRIIYGFNITYGRKSYLWTVLKLDKLLFFLTQLTSNTYIFTKVSGIGFQVGFIRLLQPTGCVHQQV
jgi:hypothetical protein